MSSSKLSILQSLSAVCRVFESKAKSPAVRDVAREKRLQFEAEMGEFSCGFSKKKQPKKCDD